MNTFTDTIIEHFYVVSCYTCGARFGIGRQLFTRAVSDAVGSIYCPTCGEKTCWQESDAKKQIKDLQRKLEWEAAEVARQKAARDVAEASLHATKGVITRMKRRVAAGVCPCCKRFIKQLANHIKTKHPDFAADQ